MPTLVVRTIKPSGGDYTSLAAAVAGEAQNLVTGDKTYEILCYNMIDTSPVNIDGSSWTTDATHGILIRAVDNHRGIFGGTGGTAAYSLQYTGTLGDGTITIFCTVGTNVTYEGLSISNNAHHGILNTGDCTLRRCLVACTGDSHAVYCYANTQRYENLVITCANGVGFYVDSAVVTAYDITADGSGGCFGTFEPSVGAQLTNCLAASSAGQGAFTVFGGPSFVLTNCASVDSSATGTNCRVNQTFTFTNAGAGDYHLSPSDTGAQGFGLDLSSLLVVSDIDNDTPAVPWNIGADQTPANVSDNTGNFQPRAAFGLIGMF